jgi:undecaprenyl-diphosphatase
MRRWILLLIIGELVSVGLFANDPSPAEVRAYFTPERAVITGIVEGATEYLPVSSTGHMIISDELLDVPRNKDVFVSSVQDTKGRRISLSRVADDYIIIIQLGAILAVIAAFAQRFKNLLVGIVRFEAESFKLLRSIALAFLPAAIVGLLAKDYIPFSITIVAVALILGGFLIFFAEKKLPSHVASPGELSEMRPIQALGIGFCQCVALIPGTSRSLVTILGGRWVGLSTAAATEFSFLVGFAILSAASIYKMASLGPALTQIYPFGNATIGLAIAAVTAFISVKWMVGFILRRGMAPFAWYRIILGSAILGAKFSGWL